MGIGIGDVLMFPFRAIAGGGYGTYRGLTTKVPAGLSTEAIGNGALKMGTLFHPEKGTASLLSTVSEEANPITKFIRDVLFKFLATARTQLANVTLLEDIAKVGGKDIGKGLNLAGLLKSELKFGDKIGGIFKLMGTAGMGAPGIGLVALGTGALVLGAIGGFKHFMSEWGEINKIKHNMSYDPVKSMFVRGGEAISALAMSVGSTMTLCGLGTAGLPLAIGGAVLTGGFMAARYFMGGVHPVNHPDLLPYPFNLPFKWVRDTMEDRY